jgi:hypothetical protein
MPSSSTPSLEGKTVAVRFGDSDLGSYYLLDPTDPRTGLFTSLGLELPEKTGEVSREQVEVLDQDVIVVVGAEPAAYQGDELFQGLRAVKEGRVVYLGWLRDRVRGSARVRQPAEPAGGTRHRRPRAGGRPRPEPGHQSRHGWVTTAGRGIARESARCRRAGWLAWPMSFETPADVPEGRPEHPLARLWRYAGGHRRRMVWAAAWTTVNKFADVAPELLIGVAVDVIVRGQASFVAGLLGIEDRFDQLVVLAAFNAVVWVVESASQYLAELGWRNLAQAIQHDARLDAYRHIQDLEVAWFEDNSSGGLLAVLNDDVNQLERFLDVGAATIIATFWNIVLVGVVFAVTSWQLTLLAFLPIPVIVAGSIRFQRRLEPFYAEVRDRVSHLSSTLVTNLGGISTIKAFTAEAREAARIEQVSDDYRRANGEAIRYSSAFVPLIRMAILTGFTFTLLVGGRLVLDGDVAVGAYSVLVFMTQRLLWPLTSLGETLDLYQRGMASTRRILDLLAVRPHPAPWSAALPHPPGVRCASRVWTSPMATAPTCSAASTCTFPPGPSTPSWGQRERGSRRW